MIKTRFWPDKWRRLRVAILDDSKLLLAVMIWPPSMFVANATDKDGVWWRSKTFAKSDSSRLTGRAVPPRGCRRAGLRGVLMLVIVGASISGTPATTTFI